MYILKMICVCVSVPEITFLTCLAPVYSDIKFHFLRGTYWVGSMEI